MLYPIGTMIKLNYLVPDVKTDHKTMIEEFMIGEIVGYDANEKKYQVWYEDAAEIYLEKEQTIEKGIESYNLYLEENKMK